MKRHLLSLSLLFTCAAHATETGHYSLFQHPPHERDADAEKSIERVVTACGYSDMSRMGPSEIRRSACHVAERGAVKLGARVARAAMDRLDDEGLFGPVRIHLYSVVGRAADVGAIEPLVEALERENKAGLGNERQFERHAIASALTAITYATLEGTPAIQWREWADAHRDRTREELLAEHLAATPKPQQHAAVHPGS